MATAHDKAKKAKAITMMFTAFGQAGEAERMATYVEMLDCISADILDKVCTKAIMECKYLPSLAERMGMDAGEAVEELRDKLGRRPESAI